MIPHMCIPKLTAEKLHKKLLVSTSIVAPWRCTVFPEVVFALKLCIVQLVGNKLVHIRKLHGGIEY